jgi:hypothetical protein
MFCSFEFELFCRYQSSDFRYAALKVASRGHKDIHLRKTNTKQVYQFEGTVVTLDDPQTIMRGDRAITYSKKPSVKLVKKYIYTGVIEDSADEEDATATAEPTTQKKKVSTKKRKAAGTSVEENVVNSASS